MVIVALAATVVIAVTPAPPSPDLAQVLGDACSEGVRPRRCAVVSDAPPDIVVEWTAPNVARVELRSSRPAARTLTFRQEDALVDAWRSLGLVAAALIEADSSATESTEPAIAPARPATPPRALWIDGAALLGSGLEHGPLRIGGVLRGGYRFSRLPLFVGASASYAGAGSGPSGLDGQWTTFSASAGAVITLESLSLRPRLDVVLARLVAETRGSPGGTSGSRAVGGSTAGLELVWPASGRFAGVFGAEGTFLSGGTAVRLGESRVSAFPALEYGFSLGLEVALLP
jgi:hypothetical protein